MVWHGVLSGGLLIAFLTAEISYDMHLFSGVVVLATIIIRVMIGLVVPSGSPLALGFAPHSGSHNKMPLSEQAKKAIKGLMAVVLLVVIGASAISGWLAFGLGGDDDLHEGLAAFAGAAIFAHIALAAAFHYFKGGGMIPLRPAPRRISLRPDSSPSIDAEA